MAFPSAVSLSTAEKEIFWGRRRSATLESAKRWLHHRSEPATIRPTTATAPAVVISLSKVWRLISFPPQGVSFVLSSIGLVEGRSQGRRALGPGALVTTEPGPIARPWQ